MTTPTHFRIAVLAGDGIGPEVIAEALKVLQVIEKRLDQVRFDFVHFSVGAEEYLRSGNPMSPETLARLKQHDAILLGAMGLPGVRFPDGTEISPQLDLREQLDLYCGLRPIRLLHPSHSPLKAPGRIDFVMVRESTEGLFSSRKRSPDPGAATATDTLTVTRKGAERIFRAAFRQALSRRRKVSLVDKANVLPSMAFFREIFNQISREFPEVETERLYVDATALYLVQKPQSFDVLVTENMFGDILSDLAAGLVGGMGMAPSADIGERHAVFQPSHGSAPDIAGRAMANPTAAILSAKMMLEWLHHPQTLRAAALLEAAVEKVFSLPGIGTADLGGTLSTKQIGDLIAEACIALKE